MGYHSVRLRRGSVLAFAVLLVAAVVGTVVLTSQQPGAFLIKASPAERKTSVLSFCKDTVGRRKCRPLVKRRS